MTDNKQAVRQTDRQAVILAVGTELTEGQIINRNAAWLSAKLAKLGVETLEHVTVPDDRPLMIEALNACAAKAGLVFVTGGLGPTSDDFTRDVIAEWIGQPLRFNESSFLKISERLKARGSRVLESHRSQALFPEHAQILSNGVGTADGFLVTRQGAHETRIWVLPGPPKEIESIWELQIGEMLQSLIPASERMRLMTWSCLGKGESELAELVEKAIAGSELRVGYRLNSPYVEIKVWARENQLESQHPWLKAVEAALEPFTVLRDDRDFAREFVARAPSRLTLIDAATDVVLAERLGLLLRDEKLLEKPVLITRYNAGITAPESWVLDQLKSAAPHTLIVAGYDQAGGWAAGLRTLTDVQVRAWPAVTHRNWFNERGRKTVCELALQYWSTNFVPV